MSSFGDVRIASSRLESDPMRPREFGDPNFHRTAYFGWFVTFVAHGYMQIFVPAVGPAVQVLPA